MIFRCICRSACFVATAEVSAALVVGCSTYIIAALFAIIGFAATLGWTDLEK